MNSPRHLLLVAISALALGTASPSFAADAPPKTQPAPFTAQLTEIEGVQALYTLRHPKLILADLDKLMAEVPEAGMLRMVLPQLTPFGYPEFSELAADANIGIALLELTPADLAGGTPAIVAFAKLKEGGKIATALTKAGMTLEKHGEWTWIAKDPAAFAKVKAPDALAAAITRPQTEELRAWGRFSPALLASLKDAFILPKFTAKLADRTPADQKAYTAYFEVLWSYFAQLHSGTASLDLNDRGLTLAYSGQFLPESQLGTWFRYPVGPSPKIAESVPADGLMNVVVRQDMSGQLEFVSAFLDSFIAVDYPPAAEPLKAAKASYLTYAAHTDGGGVMTLDMTLPAPGKVPEMSMLGVQSGTFTAAQVNSLYRATVDLSNKLNGAMMSGFSALNPKAPTSEIHQTLKENALTIDGISFGAVTTTSKVGGEESAQVQYYGVVGGNLVYAMPEAALRQKVSALAAKKPVPDAVPLAFAADDLAVATIPGGKIVDLVVKNLPLDLADADVQARIASFKTGYTAGGPVKLSVAASQAEARVTFAIPYKFIAQSVQLGQFANASKKAASASSAAPSAPSAPSAPAAKPATAAPAAP